MLCQSIEFPNSAKISTIESKIVAVLNSNMDTDKRYSPYGVYSDVYATRVLDFVDSKGVSQTSIVGCNEPISGYTGCIFETDYQFVFTTRKHPSDSNEIHHLVLNALGLRLDGKRILTEDDL